MKIDRLEPWETSACVVIRLSGSRSMHSVLYMSIISALFRRGKHGSLPGGLPICPLADIHFAGRGGVGDARAASLSICEFADIAALFTSVKGDCGEAVSSPACTEILSAMAWCFPVRRKR